MWFKIPGEPTGKERPRTVKNGNSTRTYTPEKTVLYENLIKVEFQRQVNVRFPDDAQLRMEIMCYYGLNKSDSKRKRNAKLDGVIRPTKKPDIDNCIKAVADALNGLAYKDDTQIVSVTAEKYYSTIPRVEVTIMEATNESISD